MFENGVKINDTHTYADWGLVLTRVSISTPEVKTKKVDVLGRDGMLDLTEAMSELPKYDNRQIEIELLYRDADPERWHIQLSEISNYCHGRECKIIFDSDPSYYWVGRVSVESLKDFGASSTYIISVDADPHKYELVGSLEDWLWDPFNFETDVIREYRDIKINGATQVSIIATGVPVNLVIIASAPMILSWGNTDYRLVKGKNILYDILLYEGEGVFTVTGNGTISIDYRGKKL